MARRESARRAELIGGTFQRAFEFRLASRVQQPFKPAPVRIARAGIQFGRERRRIPKIHGHGIEDDGGAGAGAGVQDPPQVGLEVPIYLLPFGGIRTQPVSEKHLHAPPRGVLGGGFLKPSGQRHAELSQPRSLQGQGQPHQTARRRLQPKDAHRPERPHHLVVAHVNNPEVALVIGAFPGNGQDDVRIDGREGHIHDFKLGARITLPEQDLEVARRPKRRFRVAHRCGFAQHENPDAAGRLDGFHAQGPGLTEDLGRKKSETEIVVLDQELLVTDAARLEKVWIVAVAPQMQSDFRQSQQDQRNSQHGRQPEQPTAMPSARGCRSILWCVRCRWCVPGCALLSSLGLADLHLGWAHESMFSPCSPDNCARRGSWAGNSSRHWT